MKKLFVIISFVLAMGLFAGCSSSNNEGSAGENTKKGENASSSGEAAEPAAGEAAPKESTISFLNYSLPSWPYNKDWLVWKLLKEKTGVTLDVQVPSGELSDALNLTVASGNLPDMMLTLDGELAKKFGDQGALANIFDYVDKDMPNFKKFMEAYPTLIQNTMSADGKLYMFPSEGLGVTNAMMYLYRKDIFDQNQLSEPKTWDELHTVLKKLKEKYPESYPLSFRNGLDKILNIAPSFETGSKYYYDFEKKEWRYAPVEDNYKKIVEYLHTFLKEGLIPPDFLSIDTKQWQDIISTNRAFVTIDFIGRIDFFNKPMRQENPDFNLTFMPPPAGWENGKALNANTQFDQSGIMVSSTSKQIDNVMTYIDYLYSEEGRDIVSWGEEGNSYKVNGDGKKEFTGGYADLTDLQKKTGIATYGANLWYDSDTIIALASDELKYAYEQAPKYVDKQQPRPAFTPEEVLVLTTKGQEIDKFREENVAKFVLGTKSLDTWSQYASDLQKLGVDEILNIYKTAYERGLKSAK
ncbi:extracellular solute-binding protein [Paenibacillus nasutitermitis]|uniref:Sugar ABC transporter substrate-binding protein n=1 Tax=Paenibacillus nasutitermitis TaxID=1652958 RepID=A0A917E001_9BACL|nr:extracellular solute-binding protein [Paenibacillus nasutitermitis]GGD85844.1 sugar ABC transporter substrate-binding protein [Paenibacillus nasutitermitis]